MRARNAAAARSRYSSELLNIYIPRYSRHHRSCGLYEHDRRTFSGTGPGGGQGIGIMYNEIISDARGAHGALARYVHAPHTHTHTCPLNWQNRARLECALQIREHVSSGQIKFKQTLHCT